MAKKPASSGSPKYPAKNNGSAAATAAAAKKAAGPSYLGNHFGKDNLNPVERKGK